MNKFHLESRFYDLLNAHQEVISKFDFELIYFITHTINLEKSDTKSVEAFYLYLIVLQQALGYLVVEPWQQVIKSKFIDKSLTQTINDLIKERKSLEKQMFDQYDVIDKDKLPLECQERFKKIIEGNKKHLKQKDYFK